MPQHANYIPHSVIPAVLLPFDNGLAINEQSTGSLFHSLDKWEEHFERNRVLIAEEPE